MSTEQEQASDDVWLAEALVRQYNYLWTQDQSIRNWQQFVNIVLQKEYGSPSQHIGNLAEAMVREAIHQELDDQTDCYTHGQTALQLFDAKKALATATEQLEAAREDEREKLRQLLIGLTAENREELISKATANDFKLYGERITYLTKRLLGRKENTIIEQEKQLTEAQARIEELEKENAGLHAACDSLSQSVYDMTEAMQEEER